MDDQDEHTQLLDYENQYETDQEVTFYVGSPEISTVLQTDRRFAMAQSPDVTATSPGGATMKGTDTTSPGPAAEGSRSSDQKITATSEPPKVTTGSFDPVRSTQSEKQKLTLKAMAEIKKQMKQEEEEEDSEIRYIDEDAEDLSDSDIQLDSRIKTESISDLMEFKIACSVEIEDDLMEHYEITPKADNLIVLPSNEEIMSKFNEQEQTFREEFLSPSLVDLSIKKEKELMSNLPLPVSPIDEVVGVGRLQSLVKLLEQLSHLKQQNEKLHKKCTFLEDTKYLLQIQNDLLTSKEQNRGKTFLGQKVLQFFDPGSHSIASSVSPERMRSERFPSDGSDIILTSTPQDPQKCGKLQRSQSDGSIELVDMDFSPKSGTEQRVPKIAPSVRLRENILSRTDFSKKSRKLQQKWEQVKKVFSGKPEHSTKTDANAVSAEQLVRANTIKTMPDKYRPPNLHNLPKHGETLHPRFSQIDVSPNLDDLPPTPNSIQSEPSEMFNMRDVGILDDIVGVISDLPLLKRSHSANSITTEEGNGTLSFMFDDQSLSENESSLEKIKYLRLQGHFERRRSSPTISIHDPDKDYMTVPGSHISRSSSVKFLRSSPELEFEVRTGVKVSSDAASKAKAAWDKVKDIIHTRKDSLKKNKSPRNTMSHALSDGEISPENILLPEKHAFIIGDDLDTRISRRQTTKIRSTSPSAALSVNIRPRRGQSSPSQKLKRKSLAHVVLTSSPADIAAQLGITDDFNKRMQEWEEKKKRGLIKANSFSCELDPAKSFDNSGNTKFTEDFIKKMEEWEHMKGLASPPKSPDPEKPKEVVVQQESHSPVETGNPALQNLSESFSKTVQEWERVKERRAQEGTSPGPESRGRPRTVERSKSRERDRSRHKYEKEIQKIERKEWKIEREKQKLERMKMKLDLAMESSSGSEGFGDIMTHEYKLKQLQDIETNRAALMTQQFEARVMASQQHNESFLLTDDGTQIHHKRSISTKDFSSVSETKTIQRERVLSDSCIQPITQRVFDQGVTDASPPEHLGMMTLAEPSRMDRSKSSETDDSVTIVMGTQQQQGSSEESNSALQQQVEEKEEHIRDLQYDIQQLTDRISLMDREHNHKMDNYKRQLKAANRMGQYSSQTYHMDTSLRELRNQVDVLIQAQDILVKEKQALEKKHQKAVEDHDETKAQLLTEIRTLQEKMDQRGVVHDTAPRLTVTALCGLITQAQGQLNHLKHALNNRVQVIKELERHLLTQRVNNKLLDAGLQRQALEISYLREQKRKRIIKRSKTFSGHELCQRQDGRMEIRQDSQTNKKYSLSKRPHSPLPTSAMEIPIYNIHSDWLDILKTQLEKEPLVPKKTPVVVPEPSKPRVDSTMSQTIMTLCNCPYIPLNPATNGLDDNRGMNGVKSLLIDSGTQSEKVIEGKEACTQADLVGSEKVTEGSLEKLEDEEDNLAVVACISDTDVPTVNATCTVIPKPGILKNISAKPPVPVAVKAHTIGTARVTECSEVGKWSSLTAESKRHSFQEWLKREPHIPGSDTKAASIDIVPKTENSELHVNGGEVEPLRDTGNTGFSPEDIANPQLPHSPVIRSKNLRKLKSVENRSMAITGDARTWKATPPRRFIRHRRNMVERLSMGAMLSGDEEDHILHGIVDTRLRTKSDSSELSAACAIARENSFKRKEEKLTRTGEHISRMQNLLEVRSYVRHSSRSSSGVRDIINRYEEGNFIRAHNFRKSPSPSVPKVSVTSPRRLKTAAELLQDSIDQKEHRSSSSDTYDKYSTAAREKLPSTSSDKENNTKSGHPRGPIRQSSFDSSPVTASRTPVRSHSRGFGSSLPHDDLMRGSEAFQDYNKPLKDLTNDKVDVTRAQHSTEDQALSDVSTSHEPGEGLVKSTRTPLSALTPPTNKRNRSTTRTKTDPTVASSSIKPESTMRSKTLEARGHLSATDSIDSQSTWSSEHEDITHSSPWLMASSPSDQGPIKLPKSHMETASGRKSRSKSIGRFWSREVSDKPRPKSKGPHRGFFDRKRTVSPSPARGALSQLCMQTMTVSLEDDSTDSLPTVVTMEAIPPSPRSDPGDKRSRRGKFMDSNWFQKPKGFFKVSKC